MPDGDDHAAIGEPADLALRPPFQSPGEPLGIRPAVLAEADEHAVEQRVGTHANRTDTDQDGLPDGEEDPDRDGLTTLEELARQGLAMTLLHRDERRVLVRKP
mgnify:CR=1 FL=1